MWGEGYLESEVNTMQTLTTVQNPIHAIRVMRLNPPDEVRRRILTQHLSLPGHFWNVEQHPTLRLSPMFVVRFAIATGLATEEQHGPLIQAWRLIGLSDAVDKGLAARAAIQADDGSAARRWLADDKAWQRHANAHVSLDIAGYHRRVAEAKQQEEREQARLKALGVLYPEVESLIQYADKVDAILAEIGIL